MRPLASFLVAAAFAAALLVYAVRGVDARTFGATLAGADYSTLVWFAPALVAYFWLKAMRWAMVLAPLGRFGWRDVAPAMMIGFAGNNVLPAHLGELVQTVVFARRNAVPASSVLVSQVLERILDVAAVLALYFAALLFISEPPPGLRISAWIALAATLLAVGVIVLALARPGWLFTLWTRCARPLPARLSTFGHAILDNVVLALQGVRSPLRVCVLLANSVAQWSAMAFMIWMSLLAFGVSIDPPLALITLAVTVVVIMLPSLPGHFGSIQAAFVIALLPFGVSRESALAASLYYLIAQWIPVTLVGGACFAHYGLRISELRRRMDDAQRTNPDA